MQRATPSAVEVALLMQQVLGSLLKVRPGHTEHTEGQHTTTHAYPRHAAHARGNCMGIVHAALKPTTACCMHARTLQFSWRRPFAIKLLEQVSNLGIVHADVKPANILVKLSQQGRPNLRLADFGLSVVLPKGQSTVPNT